MRTLARNQPDAARPVRDLLERPGRSGRRRAGGVYAARPSRGQRRTIVLPNPIRLDVTAPQIRARLPRARASSRPTATGGTRSSVATLSERAPGGARTSTVGAGAASAGRSEKGADRVVRLRGRRARRPRRLSRRLGATDLAGNIGRANDPEADRDPLRRARPQADRGGRGRKFAVLVVSDAGSVAWQLGQQERHRSTPGTLRLRAPLQPGRYTLVVSANGLGDRAVVLVRAPAP